MLTNTSHHSPPAPPAHSAPPVRPAFSTGIPSIAPPLSSFTRFDAASETGSMYRSIVVNRTTTPVSPFVAHPSTGNSSIATSSSAPASASSTPGPNETFQNRINSPSSPSVLNLPVQLEKEEGHCDREEGKGNVRFTEHGEHDVRVEDCTEDAAEDKPAYNSAHSESRESLHSADHHGHNYHTHGETTLPRDDNSRLLEQQVMHDCRRRGSWLSSTSMRT
jgi:hypothetical protein